MRERHLAGLRKQHLQLHTTGGKQQSGTAPLLLPGSSSAAGCGIGSDHPKTKAPAGPPAPASLGDVATLSAAAAVAATATQPHINAGAQASLAAELATEDLEAGEIPMDLVHTSSRDSDPDGRDSWRDRDRQGDRSRERDRGKGRGRDRPRDRTNKEW